MRNTGVLGASIAFAGCLGGGGGAESTQQKPPAESPAEKARVSRVSSNDEKDLEGAIRRAVDLLGCLDKVISKGDTVLVKPNFNSDDPFPGSSDPLFVKTVVDLLYDAGAGEVVIIESSGLPWLPTSRVFERMGMIEAAKDCQAELVVLDDREWVDVDIGGRYLKKTKMAKDIFREGAKLVWLPCMKTHRLARFTLSLKLAVGLMGFEDRRRLHISNLENKIAELNLAVSPDLIIMDGRKCFVTGGPDKGDVEEPGLILAGQDRVAVDVQALKVLKGYGAKNKLDMDVWELPQIKRAVELGIGIGSDDMIDFVGQ